ncbi:MAG: polyisoprenoid-binding protein [Actinobacteria bacterium]|nr:polyisoprenoid-binding protein [Actinomycetota bacterium]
MSNLSTATGTWVIDPTHTNLGFSARHAMVAKVRGTFAEFAGSFTIDGDNLAASSAEVTIQVASIDTKTADRDAHLKSPDFLDAETFPTITFVSTAVAAKGDDVVITGDLTIHGVTKSVDVAYEFIGISQDPWGQTKIGFEGSTKISRKEFGLTWNAALETGGVLVGDEIKLNLDVEATKQA